MNKRMVFVGVAGFLCLLVGIFFTSVIVAFVSMEPSIAHAVTREQAVAVIIGLMWLGLAAALLGMWAGYQMARLKPTVLPGRYSGWMLAASGAVSLMGYVTLPINWISHYQANFYWWFVFVHIVALFFLMVIAFFAGLASRAVLKTA